MSISWPNVDPAPALLVLPPAAASLDEAYAAIELWEHYSGKTLDATQRLTVMVVMAEAADGRWAAATTGREMPRQNGKGDEIEVTELWGLVQRSEAILHTVHDAVMLASQAQQRMLAILDHPDLRRRVKRVWKGTGQQMIEMRNGGCIWYRTRTGGGGRGVDDIDRLVVDEAQHATEDHLAAVAPTLLANANPQLNAMGTAGIDGKSDWWWRLRLRALGADSGAFGYVGHTAERVYLDDAGVVVQEPVDVNDRALWRSSNPALAAGRGGGEAFLEEQLRRLRPELFAQEHLGVWCPPPAEVATPAKIPAEKWAATITDVDHGLGVGDATLAFDVAMDGEWASIALGGWSIAEPYVELIEHRKGVGWLPDRLVELVQRWEPSALGCNGAGATGSQVGPVLAALRAAGLDIEITQLGSTAWARACQGLYADVVEGRLSRPSGQDPLEVAAENAVDRRVSDGWAWDVRASNVPISPLAAITAARALLPLEVHEDYDVLESVL